MPYHRTKFKCPYCGGEGQPKCVCINGEIETTYHYNGKFPLSSAEKETLDVIVEMTYRANLATQISLAGQSPGFFELTRQELEKARAKHAPINSLHEGYAVILEELDEFKAEVWKRSEKRDPENVIKELIQIAAMCARTAEDCKLIINTK